MAGCTSRFCGSERGYKGRGHGGGLIQRATDIAIRRGCHNIWLDTSNRSAKAFYDHLGFTSFAEL
ncbi:MAG: GNAT family N-acetyltransferase [Hoeflea sp.]|uniref:GNAT family N-acetyltransferase n=1 Tax=Hoeflea sp. TaxID=1940281 RepID=UPI003EF3CF40